MNNYLPTLLFTAYGIAMITLASVMSKEMNQENVSDRFVSSQQAILSLGSMSLAFGLLLAVLVNRNMLQTNESLTKLSLALGVVLTVSLAIAVLTMRSESNKEELKDSKLNKAVSAGGWLVVISLLIHALAGYIVFLRGKRNRSSSSSSPF